MSSNSWNQLLARGRKSGTALTNTTAATSILPAAERFNVPSNIWEVGTAFNVRVGGRISTAGSTPGTLTIDFRVGSVIVASFTTGTLAVSASNLTWLVDVDFITQTVDAGTGTTLLALGNFYSAALSAATPQLSLPASSPAVGTGYDNTVSGFFDCFGTWSVASASNSIRCDLFKFRLEN
jgi:hypothetical protein